MNEGPGEPLTHLLGDHVRDSAGELLVPGALEISVRLPGAVRLR